MTNEQRKQLHAALMEHVGIQLEPSSFEWRIFDESASEDIAKLEPFIDEMLQQAENRGRLAVYLEVVAHEQTNQLDRQRTMLEALRVLEKNLHFETTLLRNYDSDSPNSKLTR